MVTRGKPLDGFTAHRIRRFREARVTLREIARTCGVSRNTARKYSRGRVRPG
jgi:transcriptional regulator with XRE-family HTH domain